jgi:hypothetical protein
MGILVVEMANGEADYIDFNWVGQITVKPSDAKIVIITIRMKDGSWHEYTYVNKPIEAVKAAVKELISGFTLTVELGELIESKIKDLVT